MGDQVVDFEKFRSRKDQAINDQEILQISEEVGSAAVMLVRQFAEKYPDLPDTFSPSSSISSCYQPRVTVQKQGTKAPKGC